MANLKREEIAKKLEQWVGSGLPLDLQTLHDFLNENGNEIVQALRGTMEKRKPPETWFEWFEQQSDIVKIAVLGSVVAPLLGFFRC